MPPHFPPPPPLPPKLGWCQRMPPAVFPPILGLFGWALTWRRAAGEFNIPADVAELLLGAVTVLFLFALGAYVVKMMRRSDVVGEDLNVLPGRVGLAAMTMCLMLLAAVLVPYAPATATVVLFVGFAGHLWIALAVLRRQFFNGGERGQMTAALQLVFAGFIVASAAAVPLGIGAAYIPVLTWYCLAVSILICARTVPSLVRRGDPAPLRPLQAIHLAPAALVGSAAILSGQDWLAMAMLVWSSVLAGLLLSRARWLTEAGFSGFWSAFTFPIAAYAGLWFLIYATYGWTGARTVGGLVLIAATLIIPPIAFRIMQLWANGELAAKTNAAIA